jgi:enoyl reductase
MARAIVFSSYGDPSVLHEVDADEPVAGPGQIRVHVKTAGVNPVDYKMRRGDFADVAPASFPQTLGNEFAGVVDQVGDGVTAFEIGSQVLGFTSAAAYAEFVVVGADQVTAKPAGMPWEVAGALSAAGQTACNALQELRVAAGETLLIHGATGGVGTVAVQLARSAGVTVIGTASPANHDYLRSLGAIPVAYGDGLVSRVRALAPNGIDAALDLAGGEAITASLALVADIDRIGTTVDAEAAQKYRIRRLRGVRSAQTLAALADLHSKGELQILIAATYPLDQAAAAHHDLETGHIRGKIVLTADWTDGP